ncbi:hypothetical protein Aph01nite_55670 [Acrocarpospora phusangensis]|uniref:Gamma-glutamyl-gamma-aminobutyrate hydrolase n=1 Tax=Acrocarpospora phusangensis TaxID=1070424 RepID=A0A919UQU6_9ACTN|nr:gamma-glutamyl-gamma-aminobutyrate hydrolase family protein [Acrocarpospora phusangensis]GIH27257.1 hypothetical protein Aph01nite_55670 [Acrocarpospora phusangensis]
MRPVIGITCYVEPAAYTVWETPAALLPYDYVRQVERAGGQPVILPPAGDPVSVIGRLDGLILAGGGDVDPGRYAADPHPNTSYIRKFRDEAEFRLVRAALAAGMPLLGICRGMQVLNVALGGTLHQHVPDVVGHTGHSPAPGSYGRLPVRLAPELAKIYDAEEITPAHYHHQSIERLADGLVVTGTAEDGTIEAVDLNEHVRAVQWHPEVDEDGPLFDDFVARFRSARRGG